MSVLPKPIGPYSAWRKAGEFVFCSGQLGIDPQTGAIVQGVIEEETRQVLENVKAVLEDAGSSLKQVVKTTIFLTDLAHFAAINQLYSSFFCEPYPARSTIQVAALSKGARIEIEVIATKSED